MEECVFCKIRDKQSLAPGAKQISATFFYESEGVMAFEDAKPAAQVHILIIPKVHIPSFLEIEEKHQTIISEMTRVAQSLIREKGVENKYRMSFNGGSLQHVQHLHWHLLGGDLKINYDY
ncbi:HIT domain-containing protein [Candidatus Microgenomates bacterium]|nr:HIT domain-containing protein [Candidatus Microgenomates bacterium]